MNERFKWQYIEFANGSNPYISKTKEDFEWMQNHYKLTQLRDGFWLAEER